MPLFESDHHFIAHGRVNGYWKFLLIVDTQNSLVSERPISKIAFCEGEGDL